MDDPFARFRGSVDDLMGIRRPRTQLDDFRFVEERTRSGGFTVVEDHLAPSVRASHDAINRRIREAAGRGSMTADPSGLLGGSAARRAQPAGIRRPVEPVYHVNALEPAAQTATGTDMNRMIRRLAGRTTPKGDQE